MDQLPHSRPDGFTNNGLYGDSQQQYNAYDNLFSSAGPDQSSYDNSWSVNTSNYLLPQSRAQAPSPSWASHNPSHALHSSTPLGNANAQLSPYSRPVSQSPAPYGQHAYNGYNPTQNFQYQQSHPPYDPALFQSSRGQDFSYSGANYQIPNTKTIAPQALQHDSRSPFGNRPTVPGYPAQSASNSFSDNFVDQQKLVGSIPAGADSGLFTVINFDNLSRATNTTRMGNYINVGNETLNWDINRAAIPNYTARRSRNELRKAAGNDSRLLAKIGKKSTKLQRIAAAPKTPLAAASAQPSDKIKYEGDSSSEESSSEDDDSSDTSDDDTESAPLPSKRPDGVKAGTEYDAIKTVWRSKKKTLSADSIRKGLMDFWELTKTIRDRWKADANAVEEAKKKEQKSQLPLLESRVKDGRDMMEAAFRAALKHGHRSIVEIMSENESLIYLCYQFLLDRFKSEDFDSPLPRAMLELMSIWTSLTEERIEKTHLGKVLMRFAKHGNARTKYYTNKITSNAAVASKETKEKASSAPAKKVAAAGGKIDSPTQRQAEPVAGVKRPASGATEGNAAKRVASGSAKPSNTTATKQNGVVKKTASSADASKPASTSAPATKTKTVTAKPSGIFSSLSAAKKPGTSTTTKTGTPAASTASKLAEKKANAVPAKPTFSFAETMANLAKPKEEKPAQPKPEKQLPPETPEQKAKRLRKESRRHLRVSFKRDDELTEVRYFTHDPDEELGHDASQMRDVSDVGGEGRMFKQQHQMMDVDDEEEASEEDDNKGLVAFKEPSLIDFSDIDPDERARNYAHRGGGEQKVDSQERAARDYYDANNLIVFYTSPEDIPPDPREPSNPYTGEAVENAKDFARPEDKYAVRGRQKRAMQGYHNGTQQHQHGATAQPPPFNFSQFSGLMNQQQSQSPLQYHQQPASAQGQPDIHSILASLKQANPNQPTPPPPPQLGGFPPNFQAPSMMPGMQPPQQQQPAQAPPNIDLAAILAQINGGGQGAQQAPAMAGFAPPMNFGQQGQQQYQNPQNALGGGNSGGASRGENRMSQETRNNPATNAKYKTKTCQFWQKGKCQKGEDCSYKHSE